ncbi:MAG: thermonuclease family protein [Sulfolobales archaeon]
MLNIKSLIIASLILALTTLPTPVNTYQPIYSSNILEIDAVCDVYHVVDGDTFDCFPIGRVRLADINAPELETLEGLEAKQALTNTINSYGPKAYIDVDDVYVKDSYNRLVVTAYLRYNDTHLLNINKWLLQNGYAELVDYRNEFNPSTWELYVYYPSQLEAVTPTITTTVTFKEFTTITSPTTVTKTTTVTIPSTHTIATTITQQHTVTVKEVITTTVTYQARGNELITYIVAIAVLAVISISLMTKVRSRST